LPSSNTARIRACAERAILAPHKQEVKFVFVGYSALWRMPVLGLGPNNHRMFDYEDKHATAD
jgi:hypothetical protein